MTYQINFSKYHDLWLEAKKRVKYIWVPEIMIYVLLQNFFGEQIKSLCGKQSKLNF